MESTLIDSEPETATRPKRFGIYEQKGDKVFFLTYLGKTQKMTPKGWKGKTLCVLVQCDCGKIFWNSRKDILNGRKKSCGCWRQEATRNKNFVHGEKTRTFTSARYNMLSHAKRRAKASGLSFDLVLNDIQIPEVCPILGIPIISGDYRTTDNSPSIDRIIPRLGYIKSNIVVISHKANRIKNNGSLEDLRKVVQYLEFHGERLKREMVEINPKEDSLQSNSPNNNKSN